MILSSALTNAYQTLQAHSLTAKIDSRLLLMHVLQCDHATLYAYPEKALSNEEYQQFNTLIRQRVQGTPVAYLTGEQGFWNLTLNVTPDTLIPRPETELLISLALTQLPEDQPYWIADCGTGSGTIALTLANERPQWKITATDYSKAALTVARNNADRLKLNNVTFHQGDWCDALPETTRYHAIFSNPPYIPEQDPHLNQGDLRFEPQSALASGPQGIDALLILIHTAKSHLRPGGTLYLEHGIEQSDRLQDEMQKAGYQTIQAYRDLNNKYRVVSAKTT